MDTLSPILKWPLVLVFVFSAWLPGCGVFSPGGAADGGRLEIYLPPALSRTAARWQRFSERVRYLELSVSTRSGQALTRRFAPGDWSALAMEELQFPSGEKDALTVLARVWDTHKDGSPRAVPALSGRAFLRADHLGENGAWQIPVRLSMKVSVSEYDP